MCYGFTNPQPAEMQVKIEGSTNEADPCDGVISTEIEILSSKLGNIKDVFVIVNVPSSNSILLGSGSAMVEYPISSGYHTVGTPDLTDHTYTFTSADIDSIIATDGLVGVTNVAANKVRLKFDLMLQANFQVGDKVVINVGSKKSCGDDLPTIVLNYDPNAVFGRTTGIGLDEKNDSWGMAWGDYNNDDYPDLFVTNYNPDEGSKLYHNNGDGSFSEVTTGIHMTPGPSLASSWGDYDNDGDLDIFVTYNIGSKNVLARNNGDGTFTCVQNDPIVNYDGYSHGASWGDYDNDGYLDMFVAEYYSTRFNLLYHNNGDGTFTQNTTSAISLEASSSIAGIWGDIDNDGDIDLLVGVQTGRLIFYENIAGANMPVVFAQAAVDWKGIDVGNSAKPQIIDVNRDGKMDLLIGEKNIAQRIVGTDTLVGHLNYLENIGTTTNPEYNTDLSAAPNMIAFGGVDARFNHPQDGYSAPVMLDFNGSFMLFVGTIDGSVKRYTDIDNNLNGRFQLEDEMYGEVYDGSRIGIALADLNDDDILELVVGNFRGGLTAYQSSISTDGDIVSSTISAEIEDEIKLYPNPAHDFINIELGDLDHRNIQINIYNSIGQILVSRRVSESIEQIETNRFAKGIYFCEIKLETERVIKKFVVK